jgi:putative endonuclease
MPDRSGGDRASAPRAGPLGEEAAARFLARRGFVILERNLRSRLGEIDLVARDRTTLVFVEVKTRRAGAPEPPEAAVDARKRARVARAALGYVAARRLAGRACRFDVVAVTLADGAAVASIRHLPGAFDVPGWAG